MIAILVLGSLWGLSEVVVNGGIRAAGLPYRAGILAGVGMGIMGIAMGLFGKARMLVLIGLLAVLLKQLVVPILHVSVLCKANSCIAVMFQGLALATVVSVMGRRFEKSDLARITTGVSAGLLAALAFYPVGIRVAPCPYLLSFCRPGGYGAFMAAEGLIWAAFSGILLPAGYWLGQQMEGVILVPGRKKPVLYYAVSGAVVACCWVAGALAIAAGI